MDENIKKEANVDVADKLASVDEQANNAPKLKTCPYCGETILATARKCKHCGEWLQEDANAVNTTAMPVSSAPRSRMYIKPPKYKNYRLICLYWTPIFLNIFFATKEVFYEFADFCNVLVFIYFMVGLKKYAQYKGAYSSAFGWLIGFSLIGFLVDWLFDRSYTDVYARNTWLLLACIALLLVVGYYIALFAVRKTFKNIGESFLVKSLTVYIIVSIIMDVIMLVEEPMEVVASFLICLIDLCFYFVWCKFFSDKEDEECVDVNIKKKPFWRKMLNSYVDLIVLIGIICIAAILLNLIYLAING